jgi:hypothetical protein
VVHGTKMVHEPQSHMAGWSLVILPSSLNLLLAIGVGKLIDGM